MIDWKHSRIGDPAHDLAIVTLGFRPPFKVGGGLHHLLDAYHDAGGHPLTRHQIHFHEIAMVLGWIPSARRGQDDQRPEHYHAPLRGVLARAEKAGP